MDVDDLRGLFLFDGAQRRAARPSCSPPARRSASTRARSCSTRASPPTSGGCCSTGRVELVRRAGREEAVVMRDDGPPGRLGRRLPGLGPTSSSYLATGRGASAGRMFRVPSRGARRAGARLVPVRRPPDRGLLPDGPQHGLAVPPARGAHRARHAGRRARPRDQQPGLGHGARGRRAAATRATRCCRRSSRLAEQSLLAEQFVALDALRREIDASAGDRRRPARRRRSRGGAVRLARRATASTTRGASRPRSPRPASTSRGASAAADGPRGRHARARPRLGGRHAVHPGAARRDEGVDGAHLGARRRRAGPTRSSTGRRCSSSTSPRASRARS